MILSIKKLVVLPMLLSVTFFANAQRIDNDAKRRSDFNMYELQGKKAETSYETLKQNGFGEVKEVKGDGVTYKLWWNSRQKQCIKTTSKNYYIVKVENSDGCDKSSNATKPSDGNKGFDMHQLQNMKAVTAYETLKQHGFGEVKDVKGDDVTYKLWWNSRTYECIKTTSKDYYIFTAEKSDACEMSFNKNDLQGMKAVTAYETLKQRGFGEVKEVKGDGVTYKLWWNSHKNECIKTTSKNYYIIKVENSDNCK